MKRILVFGMTENPGGVESFLMNYYRHIDRSRIQFDFLANSHESVAYEQEIISMGARVFHITARSENLKVYKKELKRLFVEHSAEWQAIWVNVCSLANIDYLKIAKQFSLGYNNLTTIAKQILKETSFNIHQFCLLTRLF